MSEIIHLDKTRLEKMRPNFRGSHAIYNFILDDKLYYFKQVPMRELIMEMVSMRVAYHLGLPYLDEQVAIVEDEIGLLSESYLHSNESSYNLHTLMENYFYEMQEDDEDFFDYQDMRRLNNLEDIWFALEEKYSPDTVEKLMNGICDIFMFDMLLGEGDRTLGNIEIIEGEAGVRLAPIHDTSSIYNDHVLLGVDNEDYIHSDIEKLNKFLNTSDSYYSNRFYSFLNTLETIDISSILNEVIDTGVPIDTKLQEEIASNFHHRCQVLKECKRVSNTK